MSIVKAVAYVQQSDSFNAGKLAMEEVLEKMGGQRPDFLMMFITVGHDISKAIEGIRKSKKLTPRNKKGKQ